MKLEKVYLLNKIFIFLFFSLLLCYTFYFFTISICVTNKKEVCEVIPSCCSKKRISSDTQRLLELDLLATKNLINNCSSQARFCSLNATNDNLEMRNAFFTLGFVYEESLALKLSELTDFSTTFFSVLHKNPETIIYNKSQKGRTKFRMTEGKKKETKPSNLLSKLKLMLNRQIWACQSILSNSRDNYDSRKVYSRGTEFSYRASGNHVQGPDSFRQFPHHDDHTSGFPSVCGIGFYLQNVTSLQQGPLEIWPGTHHLLGSYALGDNKRSSEAGLSSEVVKFYETIALHMPSKFFLGLRGDVILRDYRALHRGREITLANFNRTMVELFVRKK